MSANLYGGDEVGAIVFDLGSYSLRAGYAGEDSPKAEVPACLATYIDDEGADASSADTNVTKSGGTRKFLVDSTGIRVPKPESEIVTYMREGMIEKWDLFEKVLDHTYSHYLQSNSEYHPVLFSEPPLNEKPRREKLMELAFEKYKAPAFFLVKSPVLSAFANGRSTGLVLDSGASRTSAVPVHDGYCLLNAVVHSPLAGDFVTFQCKKMLDQMKIDVIPSYMVGSKEAVNDNEPARWTKKVKLPTVGKSFHDYMVKEVLQDFQAAVVQIADTGYHPEAVANMPMVNYEFPNGYHQDFGGERFKLAEPLFEPSALPGLDSSAVGMAQMVALSANMCDVDLKPSLYNNVILAGGNTLLQGFVERLNRDLCQKAPPSMRMKVVAAPGGTERRFSSWIGGSILASLGTFQQMWISKQEYEESGRFLVDKKCP